LTTGLPGWMSCWRSNQALKLQMNKGMIKERCHSEGALSRDRRIFYGRVKILRQKSPPADIKGKFLLLRNMDGSFRLLFQ
jgi:hypothetical protein